MNNKLLILNDKKNNQPLAINNQQFSGFTLLELLVVISIIAILLSIGITSFSTAQKKSRDSKRKSDLRDIKIALEQYYSVCGSSYPPTPAPGSFYTSINCTSPAIDIMPTVPLDPRSVPYVCPTPNCTSTAYEICAAMESEASDYCLTSQQ